MTPPSPGIFTQNWAPPLAPARPALSGCSRADPGALAAGYLAFEWLHRRVYNHVGLEGLLLHEGLEADVALVGPDAGVDQHVPLHVGLQGELPAAHLALELLHALAGEGGGGMVRPCDGHSLWKRVCGGGVHTVSERTHSFRKATSRRGCSGWGPLVESHWENVGAGPLTPGSLLVPTYTPAVSRPPGQVPL